MHRSKTVLTEIRDILCCKNVSSAALEKRNNKVMSVSATSKVSTNDYGEEHQSFKNGLTGQHYGRRLRWYRGPLLSHSNSHMPLAAAPTSSATESQFPGSLPCRRLEVHINSNAPHFVLYFAFWERHYRGPTFTVPRSPKVFDHTLEKVDSFRYSKMNRR